LINNVALNRIINPAYMGNITNIIDICQYIPVDLCGFTKLLIAAYVENPQISTTQHAAAIFRLYSRENIW
jgi:hypothetical protein